MSFPRAMAIQIPIELFDPVDPTSPKTGLSFGASDVKIAKDGGSLANTTNAPTEAANGLYWLQLTASEMDAMSLIVVVSKSGVGRSSITIGTHGMPSGAAITGTLTSTIFATNLSSSSNDAYKDLWCTFTTGALAGQSHLITGYNGTTKVITVGTAYTAAPSNGDMFVLINR